MYLSTCAMVGVFFAGLIALAILYGASVAITRHCAERRVKNPERLSFQVGNWSTAFAGAAMVLALVVTTKGWKPCGQDSVSQAIKGTPASVVMASLPCPCGCGCKD